MGTFGNTGKNILRGPGQFNTNMALVKDTNITERLRLQFRAEAFNVFNDVNFYAPNNTCIQRVIWTNHVRALATHSAVGAKAGILKDRASRPLRDEFAGEHLLLDAAEVLEVERAIRLDGEGALQFLGCGCKVLSAGKATAKTFRACASAGLISRA